jgi:hypothetical protein
MNRPKHFQKWKERHVARFGLALPGSQPHHHLRLRLPPRFTPCVQQLPGSGAWMLPVASRKEWMLIAPAQAGGRGRGSSGSEGSES